MRRRVEARGGKRRRRMWRNLLVLRMAQERVRTLDPRGRRRDFGGRRAGEGQQGRIQRTMILLSESTLTGLYGVVLAILPTFIARSRLRSRCACVARGDSPHRRHHLSQTQHRFFYGISNCDASSGIDCNW